MAPGGRRQDAAVAELVAGVQACDLRAVARLISLAEQDSRSRRDIAAALAGIAARARIIGLTGPPGVGKSTSTSALVGAMRAAGQRVGVLAVDPSSPLSGGALLGDRIRMQEHATDDGVFIRSMASRGQLGGLASAVPQALRILDAAGFDVVLIETVGVGQAEFEIAGLADTTILLLAPGMGDGIQVAKAGILEIADVLVVNKADREGADLVARDLRHMQAMTARSDWRAPIIKTTATRGDGITDVLSALQEHWTWLEGSGELARRRMGRVSAEIEAIALEQLRRRLIASSASGALESLAQSVLIGDTDSYAAADALLANW